jgi:hypothetical protein
MYNQKKKLVFNLGNEVIIIKKRKLQKNEKMREKFSSLNTLQYKIQVKFRLKDL